MSVLYIEQMCLPGPSLLQRSGSWNAPGLPLSELRGVGTSREKRYSSDSKGYVTKKRRCKKIVQTNAAFADVPIPAGKKWGWFIIGFTMVYLIIQQPWNLKVSIHFQHIHQSDYQSATCRITQQFPQRPLRVSTCCEGQDVSQSCWKKNHGFSYPSLIRRAFPWKPMGFYFLRSKIGPFLKMMNTFNII